MDPETVDPVAASEEAVHKAKNAAQAVEMARQAQLAEAVKQTAESTKAALLEGLKEVFGESDTKDPDQMRILVRRIPILCTNVMQMHEDIAEIKGNLTWAVRIIIGAVILAVLKLIFIP